MSLSAPQSATGVPPKGDSSNYVEQALYDLSPFGVWGTTLIIFALLLASYAVAAWFDHAPWIVRDKAGASLDHRVWVAISLTLIVCCALGLQRYSRLMGQQDAALFAPALRGEAGWAAPFVAPRLRLFTTMGAVVAGGAMLWFQLTVQGDPHAPALAAWFTFAAILVGALFFRGVELTGAAARQSREIVQGGLHIDLLRIEQLYPWGRVAGRTALIWFAVSAATLLQFVGDRGLDPYTIGLVVACMAMGMWVFVSSLGMVHHEIRAAKAAELETVRTEITGMKSRLHADPAAPAKLQSLLAYEARIAAAPEWPFDQTILVRVGASALILTVPWFGQAFAGLMVQQLGH